MIRPALMADVPKLVQLLKTAHAKSKYATVGDIDVPYAKKLLFHLIARHEGKGEAGTYCMVADRDGLLVGMLFGIKARIHDIGTKLFASDRFFFVTDRATPFMGLALIDGFEKWAKGDPRVIEILMADHDTYTVRGREKRAAGEMYLKRGYRKSGEMYELAVNRRSAEAAA